MSPRPWLPDPLAALLPRLAGATPIWLVGGAVRDSLLERPTSDFDFVVDGNALALARTVANSLRADYYTLDSERGIGRVILPAPDGDQTLDFSRLRSPDITTDLQGRDYTVNAMGVALADPGELLDPTRGLQDLKDKRLRACSPTAIADDPIRAVRGVRLSTDLGLRIDPDTLKQVTQAPALMASVSPERLRDELFVILRQPRPASPLRVLDHAGLLGAILPETLPLKSLALTRSGQADGWAHALATAQHLAELLLALAAQPDEEAAAEVTLGLAILRLGRFRQGLAEHFRQELTPSRSARELLLMAGLYHDVGRATAPGAQAPGVPEPFDLLEEAARLVAERGRALRLSTVEVERLRLTVLMGERPGDVDRVGGGVSHRAAYRFFRDAGEAGLDAVLLSLADLLAGHIPPIPTPIWQSRVEIASQLLEARLEWPPERLFPPPLLRGDRLAKALGIVPGPEVGMLLEEVREAQAAGEVRDADEALEFARRLWAERKPPDPGKPQG
jgi:tRNA nucleotidyltransferase/poly(A) polymerase